MDPSQIDVLVQRLVVNPHDDQALASAHEAGESDPKSYALLLERVGVQSQDPAYASHWLSEAANVWSTTLGDAHRAARALMQAIDRDPTQRTAADRLAQLYRDKGDTKALVALLERRAKALAPLAHQDDEVRAELGAMHEELGRLWSEGLQQPKKALDHFRRAIELEPTNAYAVYAAREIHKSLSQWADAFKLYEAELALEQDPGRRVALLRDEAASRRAAGDLTGATRALARAREIDAQDPTLQQEFASSIIERLVAGREVSDQERTLGAELLVGLAEAYDGEHGLAYSAGALDIQAGHDRAIQLYAYYARALERDEDLGARYLAYLEHNPDGAMAPDVRWQLAASYQAVGQIEDAITLLEPLRAAGDERATTQLAELYSRVGRRMPSAVPAAGAGTSTGEAAESRAGRAAPTSQRPAEPPGSSTPTRPMTTLEAAQALASAGRREEAYAKYRDVLATDPGNAEASSWIEDYLRTKRDYRALRELLLATAAGPNQTPEFRKQKLREVAALSEGNLRDADGAIDAWTQLLALDRTDEVARQSLVRALDKAQRWNDLADLLEREATQESDLEKKIALEKRLAALHEQKRGDFVSAGQAWERIADLAGDDDQALATASELYEKGGDRGRAAEVIAAGVTSIADRPARDALLERLGTLREQLGDPRAAGEAYAEAAEDRENGALWAAAERCFVAAGDWARAAKAAERSGALEQAAEARARHWARAAEHAAEAGDPEGARMLLESAATADPHDDEIAQRLIERHTAAERWPQLAAYLLARADAVGDRSKRIAARREAARVQSSRLGDEAAAGASWRLVLEDGEDAEALEKLIDQAIRREDYAEATALLRRLEATAVDPVDKARIALREAELVGDGLSDVETAITRYERILREIDPRSRPALQAIADLQEARDKPAAAAEALERELDLVFEPAERVAIGWRLARIYDQLADTPKAIRALENVRAADPEDFDALTRLAELCEKTKDWSKLVELLAQQIEVEADETEVSALTKKLAYVLADELQRGDEALAVLSEGADEGDAALRASYVELGDRLGWHGVVAGKLVEWWIEARPGPERTGHLRGAFDRFVQVGRDADAIRVAAELARSKGADAELARRLEALALKTRDLDALSIAHDWMVHDRTGVDRANELVRQAEVRIEAGAPRLEALGHGEQGLTSVPPAEAEELLQRLAAIAEEAGDVVDLYERQIGRCKAPADRIAALARAAQVAGAYGELDRARSLFDLALSGAPSEDAIRALEEAAREADAHIGGDRMRRALAVALAAGGQGARDGGRTRGALLRRAATLAHRDLEDLDQALAWLGDALVAHVEAPTLDALDALAREVGEPRRAEATLSRALNEVFDVPLVRQLLARRARIRRDDLRDNEGAAADLKKLYELSPTDPAVVDALTKLLAELDDHRAMVQLYEDQILRGRDLQARAELARKVARMWETDLTDPREAADAWRRVLRMKAGDAEATAGLERAKSNMLRRTASSSSAAEVPASQVPPSASARSAAAPPSATDPSSAPAPSATTSPPEGALTTAAPPETVPSMATASSAAPSSAAPSSAAPSSAAPSSAAASSAAPSSATPSSAALSSVAASSMTASSTVASSLAASSTAAPSDAASPATTAPLVPPSGTAIASTQAPASSPVPSTRAAHFEAPPAGAEAIASPPAASAALDDDARPVGHESEDHPDELDARRDRGGSYEARRPVPGEPPSDGEEPERSDAPEDDRDVADIEVDVPDDLVPIETAEEGADARAVRSSPAPSRAADAALAASPSGSSETLDADADHGETLAADAERGDEEDVVVVDDLAEMIDADEEEDGEVAEIEPEDAEPEPNAPEAQAKGKRSQPPPLPRV